MDKYYKILGLSPGASKDDLKRAYRRLANEHHPDKGGNAETFKEINKAYGLLTGKRQLSKAERQEQEASRMQPQPQRPYNWQSYKPPPPPPKPKYYEYERDVYNVCDLCKGKGKIIEHCKRCYGTGNNVGGTRDVVSVDKCAECQTRGYKVLFVCRKCNGHGEIYVGKVKSGYWQ